MTVMADYAYNNLGYRTVNILTMDNVGFKTFTDDFTAAFVISDAMAVAAMKALHDAGKRVPQDCSVVAIDGIDMSAYMVPTLTTLVQPQEELGLHSVRILMDMIEGRSGNRHLLLKPTLRMGGSVCKV